MESYNWTIFLNLKAGQEKFADLDIKIKVLKRIFFLSLGTFLGITAQASSWVCIQAFWDWTLDQTNNIKVPETL